MIAWAVTCRFLAALGMTAVQDRPVIVASKPFGESYILAEMFAQLLEARGVRVERRPGLGATEILFAALRTNAIDVYPEYTGTGLVAILHDTASRDEVYRRVSQRFQQVYGILWLAPLGFENTYAIAVRSETAARYHLATLSDLARASPQLRGRLHRGLHRARGRARGSHQGLRYALSRGAAAGACPQVSGACERRRRRDRRLFDGWTPRALLARHAPRRQGILSTV